MSRPFGSAAALEQRRRQAIYAVNQGDTVKDVARINGVARSSVYRWLQMAQGDNGLAATPHPGPARRLSHAQERRLEKLLQQGAQAQGWANDLWTTHRIVALIRREFGVAFHHDHVGRLLHQRLGWSVQKPRRRARERDEAAIAAWKQKEFPRIVRQARRRGAHLVFLDESGFMLTPTVRRTWGPQGQTPILDAADCRDRLSAISCITVSPRARRQNFYFELLPKNKNVKAPDIIAFLRDLKTQWRGGLTMIWDGSSIHSKSRLVRAYLARHPEIVVETLPGYAPELNPDEGVWGWTKYGRLANLAATDTDELHDRIMDEFITLKCNRHLLGSFIQETGLPLAA